MAPAIEIVTIPILPDKTIADPASAEGKIWEQTLETIKGRKGAQEIYWGNQVEHPDTVTMIISWRDLQDHQDFMADPVYEPFVGRLMGILAGPPFLFHIEVPATSALATPLTAPVTEFLTCYTSPNANKSAFEKLTGEFMQAVEESAEGFLGSVRSWGIEEAEHAFFAEEGGKGRRYVALLGWESMEAHAKYRDTKAFGSTIPLLRNNVKGTEVVHVKFEKC